MVYIIVCIFGLLLGSFMNVCIFRIPKGESIAFPPSHCSSCNHSLSVLDLVPVFSFICLKGRCRYCKSKISFQYPIIEALNASIYLYLYIVCGISIKTLVAMTLAGALLVTSIIDMKYMIIPNAMCMFIAITGFAYLILYCVLGSTIQPMINGLLGGLLGGGSLLLLGGLCYLIKKKEGMGGGDIKLAAAVGLYLGWKQMLLGIVLSAYIALIVIIILCVIRKMKKNMYIPYGPFLSLGFMISFLFYDQIMSLYWSIVF